MARFVLEDAEKWGRYLGELRTGAGRHRAARSVGVTRKAVEAWLSEHPKEAAAAAEAESEALEAVEDRLWEAAVTGEPWAVKMWLERRAPDRWSERGAGGGGNGVTLVVDPGELLALARGLPVEEREG